MMLTNPETHTIEGWAQRAAELDAENATLRAEVAALEGGALHDILVDQEQTIVELRAENERLNGEPPWCDDDHCQLATLTAKNAALRDELDAYKQAFASLREENERLKQEVKSLMACHGKLAEYDRWLSNGVYFTNEEFKSHVEEYRQQLVILDNLRFENERLTSEGEMLKSEMGYHEAKDVIEQLTEQRDVFKAENERLKQRCMDVETDFKNYREISSREDNTRSQFINKLNAKVTDLTAQLAAMTQERDAALTRAMESKLNEDSLYRQLAASEARVKALEGKP